MSDIDIFEREQEILDNATRRLNTLQDGMPYYSGEYGGLIKEYGKLLKQLRRVTKMSDRTTDDLNTKKLDLLDKVHYDPLTGLYNRRYMEENMKRIIKSISRSGGMLSVLIIDVDFFKKYNDTYGHSMGDECLRTVANALNDSITRANDFVARYGGEEFIVVLPNTDENGARVMANRMLQNVRGRSIPHAKNEVADCVTISIGATTSDVTYAQTGEDYIKRADEALYMSKQNGRNRYTFIKFKEVE